MSFVLSAYTLIPDEESSGLTQIFCGSGEDWCQHKVIFNCVLPILVQIKCDDDC